MSRVLILYFSRTGYTRKLALAIGRDLQRDCAVDIEEITEPRSRKGLWGYLRSGYEAMRGRQGEIDPGKHAPGDYDIVLIGSPNWASNLSVPVQGWLAREGAGLGRYGAFVTQGGSGGEKVLAQLQARLGRAPEAAMVVTDSEIDSGAYRTAAKGFVTDLGLAPQRQDV